MPSKRSAPLPSRRSAPTGERNYSEETAREIDTEVRALDGVSLAITAGAFGAVNGVYVVFAPLFVLLYIGFAPGPFLLASAAMAAMLRPARWRRNG